jgi:hypothetical protein
MVWVWRPATRFVSAGTSSGPPSSHQRSLSSSQERGQGGCGCGLPHAYLRGKLLRAILDTSASSHVGAMHARCASMRGATLLTLSSIRLGLHDHWPPGRGGPAYSKQLMAVRAGPSPHKRGPTIACTRRTTLLQHWGSAGREPMAGSSAGAAGRLRGGIASRMHDRSRSLATFALSPECGRGGERFRTQMLMHTLMLSSPRFPPASLRHPAPTPQQYSRPIPTRRPSSSTATGFAARMTAAGMAAEPFAAPPTSYFIKPYEHEKHIGDLIAICADVVSLQRELPPATSMCGAVMPKEFPPI